MITQERIDAKTLLISQCQPTNQPGAKQMENEGCPRKPCFPNAQPPQKLRFPLRTFSLQTWQTRSVQEKNFNATKCGSFGGAASATGHGSVSARESHLPHRGKRKFVDAVFESAAEEPLPRAPFEANCVLCTVPSCKESGSNASCTARRGPLSCANW